MHVFSDWCAGFMKVLGYARQARAQAARARAETHEKSMQKKKQERRRQQKLQKDWCVGATAVVDSIRDTQKLNAQDAIHGKGLVGQSDIGWHHREQEKDRHAERKHWIGVSR
jgi:hypothetical protein